MNIVELAKKNGIEKSDLILYGENIAKVEPKKGKKRGKLVLVTAMTSNKFGVGKTTVSIGLADALNSIGKHSVLSLREPSMGPVFGVKGGATGGGKSSLTPTEDINLHFTGDFHAIAEANNLLSAIIDNHIFHGNKLEIDTNRICFKRCLDVNDRSLREIAYKIGDKTIKTGFNITASSEVMAVACLSKDLKELKTNLGNILVAFDVHGKPIFAKDLNAEDSMLVLLRDAFKPNVVRTLENTLALVHFGPFANIAHGASSVVSIDYALSHSDYCVTEAGFGSDLGGEKFLDITSRVLKKQPDAIVLVVSVDVAKEQGNFDEGLENIKRHIQNLKNVFGANIVVAINRKKSDKKEDIEKINLLCWDLDVECEVCEAFEKGSKGTKSLAMKVVCACEKKSKIKYAYELKDSIKTKIEKIAKNVYGAKSVVYFKQAEEKIKIAEKFFNKEFFVNVAKTQFSFSGDKKLLGAPTNFELKIKDIEIRSGANMIVAIAGDILLMPGLAKNSNYQNIRLGKNGKIEGIF